MLDHGRRPKLVVSLLVGIVATLVNLDCRGLETRARREGEDFPPGKSASEGRM